jgi:hypothetical protein
MFFWHNSNPPIMAATKRFLPTMLYGCIVAIAIPIFAWFRGLIKYPFEVEVSVFELGELGLGASFDYNLTYLVNLLAMSVGLNLVFWIAFKLLLRKVEGRDKLKFILEICAVLLIIGSVMGVVFHWGFDRANSYYQTQFGRDTSTLYLYLYWGDEFLGHGLQETTLLGYFLLLVGVEHATTKQRTIRWIDLPFMGVIIGVVSVMIGYAALISESAMLMLICSVITLGVEGIFVFKRNVNLRDSPLFLSTMLACVAVIVQNLVFIAIYGVMPWYPWLRP